MLRCKKRETQPGNSPMLQISHFCRLMVRPSPRGTLIVQLREQKNHVDLLRVDGENEHPIDCTSFHGIIALLSTVALS